MHSLIVITVRSGTPKELEAALKGAAKVMVLEPGKPVAF